MKRIFAAMLFVVCLAAAAVYASHRHSVYASGKAAGHADGQATTFASPCLAYIPKDWGEYIGSSSYGVAFEDGKGTIRFIKNPPCDIAFTPVPDLEIDRTR